jgi:hypothetical protein
LRAVVADTLAERARVVLDGPEFEAIVSEVCARRQDPWHAADELLAAGTSPG